MNRKTTKILGSIVTVVTIIFTAFGFLGDFIFPAFSKLIKSYLPFEGFENFIFIPLGCVGVFTLVILTLILGFRQKSHRREDLQKLARQMGWTYTKTTALPFLKELDQYLNTSLLEGANTLNGASNNVLMGKMGERNALVSDQIYSVGSTKNRRTYEKTLIGIELPEANLPIMSLYPEGFMDKVFNGLTKCDIDFPERPLFSQKYVLYGKDENQIRSFFDDRILAFYEQQAPFTTACGGKYLVIYGDGLLEAHEIMARLNFIVSLANLFLKR